MEKYRDMSIRKKSNIKMIRNLVFFIGLIIFTFWYIFKDQDLNELLEVIKSANPFYLVIATILMFLVFCCESINVRSVLYALGEKKVPFLTALKYTWIGSFFSAITPAATGGQPVEIYYMTKDDIKTANGTMAMLLQLCGFQISTLVFSIFCAICNQSVLSSDIVWFYILGLTINGFALILMLIGTFSQKTSKKLSDLNVKMMKKVKIKNIDKIQVKIDEGLKQYSKSSVFIRIHKIEFAKAVLRVFVQIGIYHSIPYFVYRSFGLNELSFFQLFSMQSVFYTTVSGIPLPGSIGVSETLFLKIFGSAFGKNLLNGAMLLYRFASFYFYLLITATVVIVNGIKTQDIQGEVDKGIIEIEKLDNGNNKELAYN
ncbi:MAG: flippase-like domain-containing protein [Bacilli bacterium]|nr:flippase-like domain-containing protein [Bacilli bacterium]